MNAVRTIKRDDRGRILPGASLNPGGRPRGFSQRVREMTNDGEELLEVAHQFLRGEIPGQSAKDRIEALKFLADRGYGRAVETQATVELADADPARDAIRALTVEQLEALASLAPGAQS